MSIASQIVEGIDNLPTISPSVTKVLHLMQRPQTNAKDFEEVIRPDPALTANILRLANSAYFRRSGEVQSVRHAISLIGTNALCDLVSSAAFLRVLPDIFPGYEINSQDFWCHSVAVAVLAQEIGREIQIDINYPVFTAGLLHDIGKLVVGSLLQVHALEVRASLRGNRSSFVQIESDLLGSDHSAVGATLAEHWNLPEALRIVTQFHHNPDFAPERIQLLCTLIQLADGLSWLLGYSSDVGELKRSISPDSAKLLGIRINTLERIACHTQSKILEMTDLFRPKKEDGL